MTSDRALACDSLEIWRGERRLCHGLSFSAGAGRAVRLHGANGTGKTTLIRVLAGLSQPESGVVRWNGRTLAEAGDDYRRSLAYLGHANGLKSNLTPTENLAAYAAMMGQPLSISIPEALSRLGLDEMADRPCGNLSMGQQRRTALARLLLSRATLWLLDEPLTSLDAAGTQLLADLIRTHLDNGGITLFATHQPLELSDGVLDTVSLGGAA